jgi:RNA polymerase sigma factor (sigma-70 family)
MYAELTDRELTARALAGNRPALEALVRRFEGLVLHIVTPLVGYGADREDLCQDVFLKLFEQLHRFRFEAKLSTWIGQIAYNTAVNFLRKKKLVLLEEMPEDDVSDFEKESPEILLVEKEQEFQLLKAIETLPPVQKTALLLFHYEELALEEIATIMQQPVNTIKSHLFRARRTLQKTSSK